MADFVIKQGDTWPPIPAQLKEGTPASPVDLTAADSVTLHLKAQGAGTKHAGGACTVTDAAAGRVTYELTTEDTDTVTTFDGEFEVDWGNGQISTFPNEGYFTVQVVAELDPPA